MSLCSIPLDRLLQLCVSLPFPIRYNGLSWGHDYGGLAFYDEQSNYPWEDRFKVAPTDSPIYVSARSDPLNVLSESLSASARQLHCPSKGHRYWTQDCFGRIPWKLRECVAELLSTEDVLNLRLASRSFLRMLDSQMFWMSRFKSTGDRGFIFEAYKGLQVEDWRALWRAMAIPVDHGICNRKRIWSIIQLVGNLLDLNISLQQQLSHAELGLQSEMKIVVVADIQEGPETRRISSFNEGCTVRGYQRIAVPTKL